MKDDAPSDADVLTGFRYARWLAYVGFTLQFILLSIRSRHTYNTFSLSADFGITYNGWIQIAHGHLNPLGTQTGVRYLNNHFELITWPLALVGLITKSGYFLLELQNVGYAGAGLVAYLWACDLGKGRLTPTATKRLVVAVAVVVVSLMVTNPWVYLGASTNYHLEPLATLFVLLAGRSFYNGQDKRAFFFVLLTLLNGDVGTTYLAALAVTLFVLRRDRPWPAYATLGVSVLWVGVVSGLHANVGSSLNRYTWLLGPKAAPHQGAALLLSIALGILLHPLKVVQTFWDRGGGIFDKLAPSGGIGILTPLALPLSLLILFENTLTNNEYYWHPTFQDIALVVIGGAGLFTIIWRIGTMANRWRFIAYPALAVVSLNALWFDVHRTAPLQPFRHASIAAPTLKSVYSQIHYSDEVVTSYGISGRFAGREHFYILDQLPVTIPVQSRRVVFVIDMAEKNSYALLHNGVPGALAYVRDTLHATPLADANGIVAYSWTPPQGATTIQLPGPAISQPLSAAPVTAPKTIIGPGGRQIVVGPQPPAG